MADRLFDLKDRVALITGSSGGLGKVLAEGLARSGVTVIINGRQGKKVDAMGAFRKVHISNGKMGPTQRNL